MYILLAAGTAATQPRSVTRPSDDAGVEPATVTETTPVGSTDTTSAPAPASATIRLSIVEATGRRNGQPVRGELALPLTVDDEGSAYDIELT
jgi:hypothetical protein